MAIFISHQYTPSGCFCFNLPYYSVTEKTSLNTKERPMYFLPCVKRLPRGGLITYQLSPDIQICKAFLITC